MEHSELRGQDLDSVSCVNCEALQATKNAVSFLYYYGFLYCYWKFLIPRSSTINWSVCALWVMAMLSCLPPSPQVALLQAQDKVSPFSVQFSASWHETSKTMSSIPGNSAPIYMQCTPVKTSGPRMVMLTDYVVGWEAKLLSLSFFSHYPRIFYTRAMHHLENHRALKS